MTADENKARKRSKGGKPWPKFGVQLSEPKELAFDIWVKGYGFLKRIFTKTAEEASAEAYGGVMKKIRHKVVIVPVSDVMRYRIPTKGDVPPELQPSPEDQKKAKQSILDNIDREVFTPSAKVETFEPSKVRRHIVLACELETNHRSKPISKHKWRPLQTGFNITEVCKIMERMDDNDHETA